MHSTLLEDSSQVGTLIQMDFAAAPGDLHPEELSVRATLLFSSQRAAECLLALTNPCWSLPIGCSYIHRGLIESTITLHPTKGEDMAMSATTTSFASLIEGIPKRRNWS